MTLIELICQLAKKTAALLSKNERLMLEARLYSFICEELKELFRTEALEYFKLLNFTIEKENKMLEQSLASNLVKDLLMTKEYTLSGIAYYTHTSEEVIFDIASGTNSNPSSLLFRKILLLHSSVRKDIYRGIIQKFLAE